MLTPNFPQPHHHLLKAYSALKAQVSQVDINFDLRTDIREIVKKHSQLYSIELPTGKITKKVVNKYCLTLLSSLNGKLPKWNISEKKREYYEYLKSPEWKSKTERLIKEAGKCNRCSSIENLQVHHLTYIHIFDEPDEDLEVLCKKCHKKEHGIK